MDQEPPYQELGYLRDELRRMMMIQSEHAGKTIHTVLIIWSGVLIFGGIKFTEINLENIPLYFIMATIFFISNLVIYYAARKYYNSSDGIFRLAAYMTVFYEKRPSGTVKVGENFSWELANIEIMARSADSKTNGPKRNVEYEALAAISTLVIIICVIALFFHIPVAEGGTQQIWCIIPIFICIIYSVVSICWLCKIPKYTFSKDNDGMRVWHLKDFIQYARETGHYTEEELVGRFGKKFLDDIGYTLTATNTVVS